MRNRVKISILVAVVIIALSLTLQFLLVGKMHRAEQDNFKVRASITLTDVLSAHVKSEKAENRIKREPNEPERVVATGGSSFLERVVEVRLIHPEIRRIIRKCETNEEWYEFSKEVHLNYHFSGINMSRLDSTYKVMLEKQSLALPFVLVKIDSTNTILEQIPANVDYNNYRLSLDTIPLGIDGKDFLVARFDDSSFGLFRQMRFMLIVSFCIVLLLTFITVFLLHTIFYQKKISEVRDSFVESIVHDLKKPVAYLNKVFPRIKTDEEQQKYINTAKQKSERLSQMIEKLLATSSMDNDLSLTPLLTPVSAFVGGIVEHYKAEDDKHIISFSSDTAEMVNIDRYHFGNALNNLLDNAIKYSGEKIDINVTCYKENDHICISVKDRGIGIPKEFQKYLFDKHFRVPVHKSLPCTGFGLGLCYVQIVANAHGGDVTVKSEYKKGSEFIITIPAKK